MISIVIPTKDRKKQLLRLINSIEKSRYRNMEIIVVNNGGKLTVKNNRIRLIQNISNQGLAFARKIGAEHAKGKYILFVDDDNIITENLLQNLVESLEQHKEFTAVGPLTYFAQDKKKIWFASVKMNLFTTKPSFTRVIKEQKLIEDRYLDSDSLHNCFMMRKEDGDLVGWFDEEVFLNGTEFDLFKRIEKIRKGLLVTDIKAIDYHDVPTFSSSFIRSLGFDNEKRVFCFQRNRGLLVCRYGSKIDKISLFLIFYPFYLIFYGILFLLFRRFKFFIVHIQATIRGYQYLMQF